MRIRQRTIPTLIRALYDGDLRALAAAVGNVLTDITAAQVPAITELIDLMRNYGAIASCMSGSGPSVFGIFEAESDAVKAYHVLKGRRTFPSLFVSRMIQG